jgi:hypothetical protein
VEIVLAEVRYGIRSRETERGEARETERGEARETERGEALQTERGEARQTERGDDSVTLYPAGKAFLRAGSEFRFEDGEDRKRGIERRERRREDGGTEMAKRGEDRNLNYEEETNREAKRGNQ